MHCEKTKKIVAILPILFDTRSMGFMGRWSIIVVAVSTKIKINLIIHILFTVIHLFISSPIVLWMLICAFTVGLGGGSRFTFDLGLWNYGLWSLFVRIP
jgi:hypothetical protein